MKALGSNPTPEGADAALKKIPQSTLMATKFPGPGVNEQIKQQAPGIFNLYLRRVDRMFPGYNGL